MNVDFASFMHRLIDLVPESVKRWLRSLLELLGIEVGLHSARSRALPSNSSEPCWVEVRAGPARGARLYLDLARWDAPAWMEGSFDSFIYRALDTSGIDLLGATTWDVGAYFGYHTLALASLVGPKGHVVAFEPNPQNVAQLRRHLARNPLLATRVQLRTEALSSYDGQQGFRHSPRFPTRGYLDIAGPPSDRFPAEEYAEYESMTVDVVQADSMLRAGVPPPSMMKIDVEGAEVEVLVGAQELLTKYRPVLAIEIHNITCMFHVQKILFDHGYKLRLLDSGDSSSSRAFVLAVPRSEMAPKLSESVE